MIVIALILSIIITVGGAVVAGTDDGACDELEHAFGSHDVIVGARSAGYAAGAAYVIEGYLRSRARAGLALVATLYDARSGRELDRSRTGRLRITPCITATSMGHHV